MALQFFGARHSSCMSIYDYVQVEYGLDAPTKDVEWQSKSVVDPPCANQFKIDSQGKLWRLEVVRVEETAAVPFKVPRDAIVVPYKPLIEQWVPMEDYARRFTFYAYIPHRDTELLWEYEAAFECGQIASIKRIKPRVIPE